MAMGLILGNIAQMATMGFITTFLFIIAKIFIIAACSFVAFLWLDNAAMFQAGGTQALNSIVFPLILTGIFAYTVASLFIGVYDMVCTGGEAAGRAHDG